MGKLEKTLSALIIWIYLGMIAGVLFGGFLGGQGGMLFVYFGILLGCIVGVFRGIYIVWKHIPTDSLETISKIRIYTRRGFIFSLYSFMGYSLIMNYLYPVKW